MVSPLQIRIDTGIKKRLRKLAIDQEKSVQEIIISLVLDYLKKSEKVAKGTANE
jgi:hypothetical protein